MKSLREVMDGMDWSGWATKPHGATQLPRPTADNYSRPVEGEGMNKAEEMASLTRGWLDLLRNPQRIASARACLEQALEAARQEGEARGFARARERAAVEAHAYMSALATHALVTLRSDADAVAGRIRAMQDESAGEVKPKDQMVAAFRSAADALEAWHVSGSPFISRRDNNWVFEACFRLREIATRITSNYGDTAGKEQG